ncbi:E3 ubiquitin-protein ligase MSL2-like isoform X1 [Dunckerocampus dactyliophorus]|uniref:E3 ubiquitin-protein ligase MSL2-like isoform X1 n=2 Tax=Dunckerocampus dactyliophorus TaxID=161453 RepID=UPI0024049250|nr:E3 ubiquitin-protein ligase MSL2-like isoform X1 [Dunckerocampus dactyliophorus]XP_054621593.1 E3 ubiquitin-protein ligase MSL2-like isoform X1 [Dunckerocampus dactyliophorus]
MNPVNATSLFVSASRSVLQCDPGDPRALSELCRLLPFFRQSLSCLVCGNLLQDPIAPTDSSCQHYVCRACKGQRMQLKPSCSWCKDYSRFQENRQLSLLVRCYRKLCLYITQSPLAPHIASAAGDSPDLQAVLNEGLKLAESEDQDTGNSSQTASMSQDVQPDKVPPPGEVKGDDVSLNGLHDCNGLVASLPPATLETTRGVVKQESFSEALPVCVSVTAAGEAGLCDISTFGEDLKHAGGPLLLSVEEVLRTLETDADPSPEPTHQLDDPLIPLSNLNGPCCPPDLCPIPLENSRHLLQSPTVAPCSPPRCHRKRSRSESDSEKVQPLPISSLLRGPPPNSAPLHPNLSAPIKPESKFPAAAPHHLAPVPNGGPPKVGKTVLVKPLKKTAEHHGVPKKAHAKARQGAPKPRSQPRVPPHPHAHPLTHPSSPSKPLYKKPVEKKGCKCGRATQNPSVLTCRGQRCPCYSNRKACQDCICRGCQNSYMANGEKKLEAFAVPEKALEQTRLTLGINLTSITTAAALRSPANSSPGNTLLNVATATGAPVAATAFLSGTGHDSRGFDDSLEMHFDC